MLNNFLFSVAISAFCFSCDNSTATNNTKTEHTDVFDTTSQPIVTTEKAMDATPSAANGQVAPPASPPAPSNEAVTASPPRTNASATPSPERTNVSPAKAAKKKVTDTPRSESKAPSADRDDSSTAPPVAPPVPDMKKSEETVETTVSSPPVSSDETKPQSPPPFSHQKWNELLTKHVSNTGKVNYPGIKSEKEKLENYLRELQNNPPESSWSRKQTMAYWINAYNAFTVKLIIDNYPVTSITKLEGGKPWDKKWIKIGGKTYSLNNIENDILRPTYQDPRIHFAVNCAAKSCPPLLNQAWTADNLESNFERQARAFINNNSFNKIAPDKIQVSKIFEWYAEDFNNLISFLNKYSTTKINAGAKVEYLEYNWDLNQ